jgi:putative ABC transport system substrate-binding protein
MRRRDVIAGFAVAAALPRVSTAQQPSKKSIGFLHSAAPEPFQHVVQGFLTGLREAGLVEGHDVVIEYRWAAGRYQRLPQLADELVARQVSVLVSAGGLATALAAKRATTSIPIIFTGVDEPVEAGLVASFSRPGGNITGVTAYTQALVVKRLELLIELVSSADTTAVLINRHNPRAERSMADVYNAAQGSGRKLLIVTAGDHDEFATAFVNVGSSRAGALLVSSDPFFFSQRETLVKLAAQHAIPTMYEFREFVVAGGLVSYGTNLAAAYKQAGGYTARILKGESPHELPVLRPTKVELIINLKTAQALGLTIPPTLLARADEVVE